MSNSYAESIGSTLPAKKMLYSLKTIFDDLHVKHDGVSTFAHLS